ncbi:metallophosphoesterase [Enterococcus saccharolyticus]|uniref:metallophosphoesterase n=1 Tax=Enterococcus saccharolyticus TaxID=41997 RepID=UPI001E64F3E0|nr:metallophosphoesterase [Enterococcus saccharolyticus]MCD5001511.1 metallophosphoesterase [Enterococcus saccharolyticus]
MKRKIIFLIVIIVIFLPIYAFQIEPRLVKVNSVELGTGTQELKVVQLSDIQLSESYKENRLDKVIKKVNQENPDLIVFTGDLFDNYSEYANEDAIISKLSELNATIGKYAVWGNHDYGGGAARVYEEVMTASGFQVLRNNGETILLANKQLFIGGLDDSLLGNPSVSETLAARQQYDYSIILTHEPDVADGFIGTDTQLVLAGHSHGGQVWVPFYQVTNVLAEKYVRGLYELEKGMHLYVNTGIGTTVIHARFGVVPEVTAFTIHI